MYNNSLYIKFQKIGIEYSVIRERKEVWSYLVNHAEPIDKELQGL